MRLRPPPPLLPWRGNYGRIFALPKIRAAHPQPRLVSLPSAVLRVSHIGQGSRGSTCAPRSTTASAASALDAFDSMCRPVLEIGQPRTTRHFAGREHWTISFINMDTSITLETKPLIEAHGRAAQAETRRLAEQAEAITRLRKNHLKAGDTIYVVVRQIRAAKTGMTRHIALFVMHGEKPVCITWDASCAMSIQYNIKYSAIRIDGCGCDAINPVVRDLAWSVFGSDDALKYYLM